MTIVGPLTALRPRYATCVACALTPASVAGGVPGEVSVAAPSIVSQARFAHHPTDVPSDLRHTGSHPLATLWARLKAKWFVVLVFLLITADLLENAHNGVTLGNRVFELLTIAVLCAAVAASRSDTARSRQVASELARDLERATDEATRWRGEARTYLDGLGEAIDTQFERWQLTPSEREVGLLLLKGLSHKEVAAIRSTSEQTVRSQAFALYRKAGLRGRHDLAAFFLEDLLLPSQDREKV